MITPVVYDNFFSNVNAVRKFALEQQFWNCHHTSVTHGNWPGERTVYVHWLSTAIFDEFVETIAQALAVGSEVNFYIESFFQLCGNKDEGWVHQDSMHQGITHVGVIYLTPKPPEQSGTSLYFTKDSNELEPGYDKSDPKNYDLKQHFENKYNRMVVYSPKEYHQAQNFFGDDQQARRLTMVFFMRLDKLNT